MAGWDQLASAPGVEIPRVMSNLSNKLPYESSQDPKRQAIAAHFNERANTFDSTPWANDPVTCALFASMIDFTSQMTVLDAGGGTGLLGAYLSGLHTNAVVVSADISPQMALGAKSKGISSIVADVSYLPFADECFDVVILRQVLQYLASPGKALYECRRVLRRHGQLLVGQFVPYDQDDKVWLKNILREWQPLKENLPTAEELNNLLAGVGFDLLSKTETELNESLSFWLERYRVPPAKRKIAISQALDQKDRISGPRKVILECNDVLFTNLFVIINAVVGRG